ncbi:MAG: DNA methylase [Nitrosomonas communis]|nr:DNA methylase [Nitrosomonas communis]
MFDSLLEEPQKPSGPVTCLGMTFENDEARRAHFTEELRKKLQDPEFRKIEGFPIGSDEDILALSDPPYYTACPNPWIADFIAEWDAQKPEQPEGHHYHREPFAADVSEGKNDPIYNAHSYHTKVPHKAIMRYILHYTKPGDIVFDGFCGTGMTGVAAQMCGDREVVMSLGYQVKPNGTILQEETDENGKKFWRPFSKLGARKAVLNDLSPIATFIANNYSSAYTSSSFRYIASKFINNLKDKWNWLYETKHIDNKSTGEINYVVWSDVFLCPDCSAELVFMDVAFDKSEGKVCDSFRCHTCNALLNKKMMSHATETYFDALLKKPVSRNKQVPALINYSLKGKRFEKKPDSEDLTLLVKIEKNLAELSIDPIPMMHKGGENWGAIWRSGYHYGITHAHHFYTSRNYLILYDAWITAPTKELKWAISAILNYINKKQSFTGGGGGMPGVLYIASMVQEKNFIDVLERKIKSLDKVLPELSKIKSRNICGTQSTGALSKAIKDETLDYVFVDPPFGANIMYSEGSFLWESQLSVWTNQSPEAIESTYQEKKIDDYRNLMTGCFSELYRILKPGRWMTVEFSNTQSSVWNSIQTALADAGFVVANVSSLDKKQGGFKAVTTPTAVKQDLVISAYKPNGGFEERFKKEAQTEEGVWDFVRTHLKYLPVTKQQGALLQFVPERDPRILFDQMIAYYVRKGYPVPISSQEFQIGLAQRFMERDGMYFLPDQVAEYDRKKMTSGELKQMTLFVSDEASAIQWLRQLIKEKPQTFSDINPHFMQQLGGWSKNEAQLDLRELLNQNFLCYDGKGPVPEQIHAYLSTNWKELRNLPKDDLTLVAKARDRWYVPDPNKAGDLEKLREKALLKEFEEYKEVKKKLKVFRLEAVRAGFKKAWQERDYAVIVAVADKIPNNVLEEDPKLLMWYDQAVTRMGGE